MFEMEAGIHTFELNVGCNTYAKVQSLIDFLVDKGEIQLNHHDDYNIKRTFKSNLLIDRGVRIEGMQNHGCKNFVKLVVNPSTMIWHKYDPLALYYGGDDEEEMYDELWSVRRALNLPHKIKVDMLSRVDITCDISLDREEELFAYLQILKKSGIKSSYRRLEFKKNSKSVPNYKEANRRSFTVCSDGNEKHRSPRIMFKAYDKLYELDANGRLSDELKSKLYEGEAILRLELSFGRKEVTRLFAPEKERDIGVLMNQITTMTGYLIEEFLSSIHMDIGRHLRYNDAKELIEKEATEKYRDQMLYLLKKTSECTNLTNAMDKLREEYDLSQKQVNKILDKFEWLDLSPITIPNRSKIKELPVLRELG